MSASKNHQSSVTIDYAHDEVGRVIEWEVTSNGITSHFRRDTIKQLLGRAIRGDFTELPRATEMQALLLRLAILTWQPK